MVIFEPGTDVFMGPESVKATVLTATIGIGGMVTYEVVWWSGSSRNVAVVAACELHSVRTPKAKIGFSRHH